MYMTENESIDGFLSLVQKINQNCAEGRNLYFRDISLGHTFISRNL
jgi:hypothetical protein